MELSGTVAALLAGGALLAALVAVVLAAAALSAQRRLLRAHRVAFQGRREDLVPLLASYTEELATVRAQLVSQQDELAALRRTMGQGLSRVGTVHYDAFPGMGGRLSFSAALLDEHGDGLVLSSIAGRSESRTYLKPIADGGPLPAGAATRELSEEEHEAVQRALHGAPVIADAS